MEDRIWRRAYAPQLSPSIDYENVTQVRGNSSECWAT